VKSTKVERLVNKQIIWLFFILVAMSVVCAFGTMIRTITSPFETHIMMIDPNHAHYQLFPNVLTFMILFQNLIPLRYILHIVFNSLIQLK
jgi:phospholipid-transporting ATPase